MNRFIPNWQKKLVALIAAIILWVFLNHSIIETKTIPNVPIRITGLPTDKTIPGMLPNGFLGKRITLTLSGTKDLIEELEPSDLEVQLDASTTDSDEWVVQITKKNLVSLTPSINLKNNITHVDHTDFILKLSPLITSKVPIRIRPPIGEAPTGYKFLDVWPTQLTQTLSGPKEEVQMLKVKGLKLVFDLENITKGDLDAIETKGKHNDEVSFIVPEKWKHVAIPFLNYSKEEINDPAAKNLRIDFLRKQLIPIDRHIPVEVFYPLKYSESLNPETHSLEIKNPLIEKEGIPLLDIPLYVQDVSTLFLDIVRDNLQIVITAAPKNEREYLQWSLDVIGPNELEDTYVAYLLASQTEEKHGLALSKAWEGSLRKRFREYLQKLTLYTANNQKLNLRPVLNETNITLNHIKPE